MLPGPRLFRSRWAALLWAGGILWTAADVAQSAPGTTPAGNTAAPRDAVGEAITAADLDTIAAAMPR